MGVAEIKKELLEEFPALGKENGYLEQCAAIGALLEEGEKSLAVAAALKKLDEQMYSLIRSRIPAAAFPPAEASLATSLARRHTRFCRPS